MCRKTMMTSMVMICCLSLNFSAKAAETPRITSWSNTKTADRKMAFLVKPGQKITFSVKAEGVEGYEWQVNKAIQQSKSDTFTWTVPDEKGIWEIHLKAINKDGTAYREWVVSTLAKSKAPVHFEYFCPDRSQKDPWGRPLPKWDKEINSPDWMLHGAAITPSKMAYGTWIWRHKYRLKGEKGSLSGLKYARKRGSFSWKLSHGDDRYYLANRPGGESWDIWVRLAHGLIHVHCMGRSVHGECCSHMDLDTDEWFEVRIIRTKDGWFYVWFGDEFWFSSLANDNTIKKIDSLRFWGMSTDCIQAYDRPVWPAKSIKFGKYRDAWGQGGAKRKQEVFREGIIIDGHGVTLKDIAGAINDPKLFRYDPASKTATCYTDLVVIPGAEIVIDGETLKMHCEKDGEHQIRLKNGSGIRLNKATVTSANKNYYLWAFTSACKWEYYKRWSGYAANSYTGRFTAVDSTISNCGNLFIDTPLEMILKRCKLVDLVEVDIGNYWSRPSFAHSAEKRAAAKGKKGLWFYNRKELTDFRIEDCTIHGKAEPIDITFIGGDPMHKVTIQNCDIDNVAAKRGYKFRDWRGLAPGETEYLACTVSPLNCKFKDSKVQSNKAWITPKYYLDVLVVDKAGRPVPAAKVRVINQVDDVQYPAENLTENRDWVCRSYVGWIKAWLDVNDLRTSVPTGKNGHTALPTDRANTLVLTDFLQDEDGRQEFTYTVRVTVPDGRWGEVKGINPGPDWYRKDPNKPARTIKVVVNMVPVKLVTPVSKRRPTVEGAKSPWPCFRGPGFAHTGRSPNVGPAKPRLLWRYKTGGQIGSSPIIGPDGTIYLVSRSPDMALHAINPDGTRKWRRTPPTADYVAPSVGIDGTIYVGCPGLPNGRKKRLRAITPEGKVKWEYENPPGHLQCYPAVGPDGTIYYATMGTWISGKWHPKYRFCAVRPDGKLKWTSKTKEELQGRYDKACLPAFGPDGTVYTGGNATKFVHALNPDGTTKWIYKTKDMIRFSPAVSASDKTVYVASARGRVLLALGFDSSVKWEYKVAGLMTTSPSIGLDGAVYFGTRSGLAAVGKDGKRKWEFKTGDCIASSPAIDAEGRIFFGCNDHYLYCIGADGKRIWRYLTGGSVVSSPAIGADGTIYVGSADGYLYAFGGSKKQSDKKSSDRQ
ncbi:MAG: PQQ-like beta-propeller repeat protein [Phycisphaerae bacterium]|nr:PQQ-like beta-propeller repeat protein [Phycisphaerae bacterium]